MEQDDLLLRQLHLSSELSWAGQPGASPVDHLGFPTPRGEGLGSKWEEA